jgi:hypothetical protein
MWADQLREIDRIEISLGIFSLLSGKKISLFNESMPKVIAEASKSVDSWEILHLLHYFEQTIRIEEKQPENFDLLARFIKRKALIAKDAEETKEREDKDGMMRVYSVYITPTLCFVRPAFPE